MINTTQSFWSGHIYLIYCGAWQQLPGPGQSEGVLLAPQQVGADVLNDVLEVPDSDECAENSLLKLVLPQYVQLTSVSFLLTSNSLCFPHSWHLYSKRGIQISKD
jgi:hypothetical protein